MTLPQETTPAVRVLSFVVSGSTYSIPAEDVLEIMRRPGITRVPHAPPGLAGLMNFHGVAIPVVRMAGLLGGGEHSAPGATKVIVYDDTHPVGLLVDDVKQIGNLDEGGRGGKVLDLAELLAKGFVAPKVQKTKLAVTGRNGSAPEAPEPELALLAFELSGQSFALPLGAVAEVMMLPEDIPVMPRTDSTAIGMFDYRQAVLPLISLAGLLGLRETAGRRHVLVTSLGDKLVGLVAGTIKGVRHVPKSAVEQVPALLQRGEGDAEIEAIAHLGGNRPLVSILSPDKLFGNREIERAFGQVSSGTAVMPTENLQTDHLQFVVFRLGEETYALPIAAVDEILQLPSVVTRVPNAPDFVTGVINLRGKALPIIDQRQRFDAVARLEAERPRVVVVSIGELQAGFIVDAVSQILPVAEADIAPAPALPGDGSRVFDRIAAAGTDTMILVVDPKELLDRAERDLLKQFESKEGSAAIS